MVPTNTQCSFLSFFFVFADFSSAAFSSLIAKAAETGNPEATANMLKLFVDIGYLEDPNGRISKLVQSDSISDYFGFPDGKSLFKTNCSNCHAVNFRLAAPALAGIEDRAPSREWIYEFTKNSSKLIAGGDSAATKIYNEYNQVPMPASSLTVQEIDLILEYIRSESGK